MADKNLLPYDFKLEYRKAVEAVDLYETICEEILNGYKKWPKVNKEVIVTAILEKYGVSKRFFTSMSKMKQQALEDNS